MKRLIFLSMIFIGLGIIVPSAPAQEANRAADGHPSQDESYEERIRELERLLLELKSKVEASEKQDEMRQLLEKAKAMASQKKEDAAALDRKFTSGLRQHSALNPNISLGGDSYFVYGTSDSDYNRIPSETSWGTGQFFLREMEMALQAPLDPFTRGKVFISFGREGVILEEGYMEWLNGPLNMNIKLGEYKTQFGVINRYHDHALPQFERPLVSSNFFGYNTLKGFGVAANFLLPSITAQVNELDLQVITGGVDRTFTGQGKHNLIFVGHWKNFWDLSRAAFLEFGLSGATGMNDPAETYRTLVGGVDFRIKWAPPERSKYRGIEWWTEFMFQQREEPGKDLNAWGFFSSLQIRLGARWLICGRIDYSQIPFTPEYHEWGGALCLDFWQSEFVFVRFQYTGIRRNFDEDDHRFILQTSWAMGPHKHEAY